MDCLDKYGYFDDERREFVITNPHTPSPWMNYLSNGVFHTMLSQCGGGLAFYKSPQIWRISRYRFYNLPIDRPGPYLYIRDAETGEYWCPSFEPVQVRPEKWKSVHGLGYTRFEAERKGVKAELIFFVGKEENALIWKLKIKNNSCEPKKLSIFTFVEFGMMEYLREVSWQCYIKHQVSVNYIDNADALVYKYGVDSQPKPEETPLVYFAADRETDGYDGDRDEFIGSYHSETNPKAVESGTCGNSTLLGGDPCGALQFNMMIDADKEENLNIFLGTALNENEIKMSLENLRKAGFTNHSFQILQKEWKTYLDKFVCILPDKEAEREINIWNPYQAQRNFLFSRNISFYATGTVRGVGFRDTSQDILAQIPFDIEASKKKVRLLLREQYRDGHANHYFYPTEGFPPITSIHSDDHLWPVMVIWNIVMETGKVDFLEEKVSYFDDGAATVYEHLKQAIEFTQMHLGVNGFPLMLRSDWNDVLVKVCREGKGESIWTAMQYGICLKYMADLAKLTGRISEELAYINLYERQRTLVNSIGWDGKWFRRAIMDDGNFVGSDIQDEAKIWLNTQTWAVISGMAEDMKGYDAMDSVKKMLDTELGIKKIHPPIKTFPDAREPLTNYNPGTGENASVFCHANAWAVIAECLLGRGDQAYKYYSQMIPKVAMEKAGVCRYKAEPYAYVSNLFGPDSDKFGLANVSWLTGTAAWMYIAATQYILGIKPSWEGLVVDPCIPAKWNALSIVREFRGCKYSINIHNNSGICKGVKGIDVNGADLPGNVIPHVCGRKSEVVNIFM
jgi:cellobiose phosphorylase